uniref:SET domain-containing protein n=3 Tax=Astatotilapia calliptera TaxID=8154 RepID=A0AAX7VL28_ASTCA
MSRRTTPLQDAINHILARRDKNSMLEIKFINSVKGRGIFTLANFKQGDFVVEYRGELIDATEAEHRRNLYPSACSVFMFDFIWKQKTLCIDGALEDGSFGRLVNDEHRTPNCRMKLIEAEGKPHLCLFALKEIAAGSEITYDYGGKEWPWRKKLKIASIPSGQQCVAEPIAHDVEHHVISTDSFTDRELKAECQSSRPTADNSEHEVHSVGGQRGTSSLKELIGEVGVQYQ